jgi:hypothetical protein
VVGSRGTRFDATGLSGTIREPLGEPPVLVLQLGYTCSMPIHSLPERHLLSNQRPRLGAQ